MQISRVELKNKLRSIGIKVEGNFVRKSDIKKIIASEDFEKWFKKNKDDPELKEMYEEYRFECTQHQVKVESLKEYAEEYYDEMLAMGEDLGDDDDDDDDDDEGGWEEE